MPFDKPQRVTQELIGHALAGKPGPARTLATYIVTCVDRHVRKSLLRNTACRNRDLANELVHDVVVYMYDNDAKLLRNWDESRGASFDYYLGLITRNLLIRRFMQFRGNPASLTPVDDIQEFLPARTVELQINYSLGLDRVLSYVERELDDVDRQRFWALFIEGLSIDALAKRDGVSTNAVHAWKSRLRRRLRQRLPEVMAMLTDLSRKKT